MSGKFSGGSRFGLDKDRFLVLVMTDRAPRVDITVDDTHVHL